MNEAKQPPPLRVRSVPGRLVTRHGYPPGNYVGASHAPETPEGFRWSPEIVEIPAKEYAAHRRAYDTAIACGDLYRVKPGPEAEAPSTARDGKALPPVLDPARLPAGAARGEELLDAVGSVDAEKGVESELDESGGAEPGRLEGEVSGELAPRGAPRQAGERKAPPRTRAGQSGKNPAAGESRADEPAREPGEKGNR